jgi:tRNA A37 threonylcarbamoyladenosine dehydratase
MVSRNIGVYTKEEQAILQKKKVIIFGLGGVGGYEAILFSRMGIGHLTGVDPDVFEISNINRQMLATSRVIGKAKAKVAEEVVTDIHPYLSTNFLQKRVDEDNVKRIDTRTRYCGRSCRRYAFTGNYPPGSEGTWDSKCWHVR